MFYTGKMNFPHTKKLGPSKHAYVVKLMIRLVNTTHSMCFLLKAVFEEDSKLASSITLKAWYVAKRLTYNC